MKTGYSDKRFGLIGEKLSHSFSPQIHACLGDYPFYLEEIAREKLGDFMTNNRLDAFCVTIPYKKDVIPYLDHVSDEAYKIGAVNVVVKECGGKLHGYNTDYFGFEYMLNSVGADVMGKKALVIGKGGASATVCSVLYDKGVRELAVIGRADNKTENLKEHSDAEIIVNASPVGMYPNNLASPVDLSLFPECEVVLDLIYNPARTALILDAERRGITAINGLPMLVAQAARAFELFTKDQFEEGCIERITERISKDTRSIVLVGMPGCGKSTVGEILAKELGREFFDADEEFSAMHGIKPADAIKTLGENTFREMEHLTLCELGKKSSAVIATGGGAVTRDTNYDPLHQNGVIVYVKRDIDKLSTQGRPLSLQNSPAELYKKRRTAYTSFADIEVENSTSPEDTVRKLTEALRAYRFTCTFK